MGSYISVTDVVKGQRRADIPPEQSPRMFAEGRSKMQPGRELKQIT